MDSAQNLYKRRAEVNNRLYRSLNDRGCTTALIRLSLLQARRAVLMHNQLETVSFWTRFSVAADHAKAETATLMAIHKDLLTGSCSSAMRSIQRDLGQ